MRAVDFTRLLLTQAGDRYVYGAEVPLSDPDPKAHGLAFDCSELVQWGTARIGVPLPDGSSAQYEACQRAGTVISIDRAIRTQGALLFHGSGGPGTADLHVAVSLGQGQTIEARGSAYGVGSWSAYGRPWTAAALVPGLDYSPAPAPPNTGIPPFHRILVFTAGVPMMHGVDVLLWQRKMIARGWNLGAGGSTGKGDDGIFGSRSATVCGQFQAEKHLTVSRRVDEVTWHATWAAPVT